MKPMLNTVWMIISKKKPRILVTSGEPAGIGPDLIIKLTQLACESDITIVGDPAMLQERARLLSIPVNIIPVTEVSEYNKQVNPEDLKLIPVQLKSKAVPGKPDINNAAYILETLDIACRECLNDHFDAMVTTPLQKSIINDAGIHFTGHTEYLANRCNDAFPVMLLACPDLRVALVTTHLPLRDVPDAITPDKIENVLRIIIKDMHTRFGITKPAITVCGLNPHAGEDGHLGTEEQTAIIPVIKRLQNEGNNITGPLSADTAFRTGQRQITDVFVAMYHDQGLPVLKTLGFGEAVNITLGLPIIRTSVDHGTALELAGTGKASCDSLLAAIEMAEKMVIHQINTQNNLNGNQTKIINEC